MPKQQKMNKNSIQYSINKIRAANKNTWVYKISYSRVQKFIIDWI